jgi:hypothetical protein
LFGSAKFMQKNQQNRNNRSEKPTLWLLVALAGVFAYTLLFFSQPSQLGFANEAGEPLPRWLDLTMLFLWEALVEGLSGHGRFQLGIADRLPILLGGSAWMACGWWIGMSLVANFDRSQQLSHTERGTLAILIGLALLSTVTLIVGLAGGLASRWPLLAAIASLVVAASVLRSRTPPLSSTNDRPASTTMILPRSVAGVWAARILPVVTCMLGIIYVLGSLVTPFEFDVVEYHLQAPKEFWKAGTITFNAHNVYANMPLGAEMHSLAAMTIIGGDEGWWWGGLVGKFVIGSYSILGASLVGGFISRQFGNWSGWAAAALVLSAPGNSHVATAGLIDFVVAAYVLAMLVVFSHIRAATDQRDLGSGIFVLSLTAGAAAACKYPGLIYAVLPMLVVVLWLISTARVDARTAIKLSSLAALGLCVTCVPWLAKNLFQTGNPVYPLVSSLFHVPALGETEIERWSAAHRVPVVAGAAYNVPSLLSSMKQLWLTSPFLSPTLISLAACGLFGAASGSLSNLTRQQVESPQAFATRWFSSWFAVAMWILAIWWFTTHRIDRFWLALLPVYAAFGAAGVAWIGSKISVTLATGLVLLSIAYGALISLAGTMGDNRFFVQLSELRVDIGDEVWPGRLSQATQWVNEHLAQPENQILLVGEARVFDFVPPVRYATCFNVSIAEQLLRGASEDKQRENLRADGVTHVLIHWGEIRRYRSPGNYGFSDWPQRSDIESLVERGIFERVAWPFDPRLVELFRIRQ